METFPNPAASDSFPWWATPPHSAKPLSLRCCPPVTSLSSLLLPRLSPAWCPGTHSAQEPLPPGSPGRVSCSHLGVSPSLGPLWSAITHSLSQGAPHSREHGTFSLYMRQKRRIRRTLGREGLASPCAMNTRETQSVLLWAIGSTTNNYWAWATRVPLGVSTNAL